MPIEIALSVWSNNEISHHQKRTVQSFVASMQSVDQVTATKSENNNWFSFHSTVKRLVHELDFPFFYFAYAFSRRGPQNSSPALDLQKISWPFRVGSRSSITTSTHSPNTQNLKWKMPAYPPFPPSAISCSIKSGITWKKAKNHGMTINNYKLKTKNSRKNPGNWSSE